MTNYIIGIIGIVLTLIMVIALNKTSPKNEPIKEPNKEDIDWTGTTQGDNE
tara:strand:+ start:345 stop:497 length:153 start_codon:yes stop_codon:yes gene_type:complete